MKEMPDYDNIPFPLIHYEITDKAVQGDIELVAHLLKHPNACDEDVEYAMEVVERLTQDQKMLEFLRSQLASMPKGVSA